MARDEFPLTTGLKRCLKTWPLSLYILILTLQLIILNFLCLLSFSISPTSKPAYVLFLCLSHIKTLHKLLCWVGLFPNILVSPIKKPKLLLPSVIFAHSIQVSCNSSDPILQKRLVVSCHNCTINSVKTGIMSSVLPFSSIPPKKTKLQEKVFYINR